MILETIAYANCTFGLLAALVGGFNRQAPAPLTDLLLSLQIMMTMMKNLLQFSILFHILLENMDMEVLEEVTLDMGIVTKLVVVLTNKKYIFYHYFYVFYHQLFLFVFYLFHIFACFEKSLKLILYC